MRTALRSLAPSLGPAVGVNCELADDLVLHIPANAHNLLGFRAWALSDACPEKLRVTYLSGEIYVDMSKEEIRSHADVKTEVSGALWALKRVRYVRFGHLILSVYFRRAEIP